MRKTTYIAMPAFFSVFLVKEGKLHATIGEAQEQKQTKQESQETKTQSYIRLSLALTYFKSETNREQRQTFNRITHEIRLKGQSGWPKHLLLGIFKGSIRFQESYIEYSNATYFTLF